MVIAERVGLGQPRVVRNDRIVIELHGQPGIVAYSVMHPSRPVVRLIMVGWRGQQRAATAHIRTPGR